MRKQYIAREEKSLVSRMLGSGKEKMKKSAEVSDPLRLYLFTDVLAKCLEAELGGPRMPELVI